MSPTVLVFIVSLCTDLYGPDTYAKRNHQTSACFSEVKHCVDSGSVGPDLLSQPLSFCIAKHLKRARQ